MSNKVMTYQSFLESLNLNKVHFVSGNSKNTKRLGLIREPLYALETSGTVEEKVYLHSLSGIQKSCENFFSEFNLSSEDKWGGSLSRSHVAGFSILARTYFGKLREPHFFKWDVLSLEREVVSNEVTVLSCVPTQIFDIVRAKIKAPTFLKHVFVGGAALSENLFNEAKKLGWPLVQCYGSTETFAQMSYSTGGSGFKTFPNWKFSFNGRNELILEGPSLFVGLIKDGVYRSRQGESFNTQDIAEAYKEGFKVLGKSSGLIKIKGSYFDFNAFKSELNAFLLDNEFPIDSVFPVALKEERNGAGVYLVYDKTVELKIVFEEFPQVRGAYFVKSIERTSLGKIKASLLSDVLKEPVLCF